MLRSSALYLFFRVASGMFSVLAMILLSRLLTADEYGRYALISATCAFIASIGFQWVNVSVARFFPGRDSIHGVIVGEAMRLYCLLSVPVLAFVGAVFVWRPWPWMSQGVAALVLLGVMALGVHSLGLQFANAKESPTLYGVIALTRSALGLALACCFVMLGFSGEGAAAGFLVAAALSALLVFWGWRGLDFNSDPGVRRQMIMYGMPLGIVFASNMILEFSGRFIVGFSEGEAAAGGFSAGFDFIQQFAGATTNALYLAAYPVIVRSWEQHGKAGALQPMGKLLDFLTLCVPLVVAICVFRASQICDVVFGHGLRAEAAAVMPWAAAAILLSAFKAFYLDIAFQLSKRTRAQLWIAVGMALVNVVAGLLLSPRFGAVGVAIGTNLAFGFGAVCSWWFGRAAGLYDINLDRLARVLSVTVVVSVLAFVWPAEKQNSFIGLIIVLGSLTIVFLLSSWVVNLGGFRDLAATAIRRYFR